MRQPSAAFFRDVLQFQQGPLSPEPPKLLRDARHIHTWQSFPNVEPFTDVREGVECLQHARTPTRASMPFPDSGPCWWWRVSQQKAAELPTDAGRRLRVKETDSQITRKFAENHSYLELVPKPPICGLNRTLHRTLDRKQARFRLSWRLSVR